MSIETRLVVAAVGSRLAHDDAVGLELVEALIPPAGVTRLLWEDADALTLAHELLQLSHPLLLIDCADLGLPAGQWRHLDLAEVRLGQAWGSVSCHGLGLAEALEIARQLGFEQRVQLFLVQPYDLLPGSGLSPEMRLRFPELQQALQATVAQLLPREDAA